MSLFLVISYVQPHGVFFPSSLDLLVAHWTINLISDFWPAKGLIVHHRHQVVDSTLDSGFVIIALRTRWRLLLLACTFITTFKSLDELIGQVIKMVKVDPVQCSGLFFVQKTLAAWNTIHCPLMIEQPLDNVLLICILVENIG